MGLSTIVCSMKGRDHLLFKCTMTDGEATLRAMAPGLMTPIMGANGHNRLDSNDAHGLYASGKHTGGNNSSTLVVANADWKVNQWVGYSVTNITQKLNTRTGAVFHPSSCITANTNNTITYMYVT